MNVLVPGSRAALKTAKVFTQILDFLGEFSSFVSFFFVSKFSARRFDQNSRLFPDSKRNSRLFPDFLPQNQIQDCFWLFPDLEKCGHPVTCRVFTIPL